MTDNRPEVSRSDLDARPYALWNAYVHLLAMAAPDQLTPRQRVAWLAFWYDNEVQNGGHSQYFENRGTADGPATVAALRELGGVTQAEFLTEALARHGGRKRRRLRTADEYVAEALHGEYDDLDRAYYDATPSTTDLLQAYLNRYTSDFVRVTLS